MGAPMYRYGRSIKEIGRFKHGVVLSEGLMSHTTRIEMEDELSEAGATIYLSRRCFEGDGQRFKRIITSENAFRRKTHTYASDHPDESGTVIIHSFQCDCNLPETVWIRVGLLEPEILAAALEKEWIEGGPDSKQSKMDDFANIEVEAYPSWCSIDEMDAREARSTERAIRDIIGGSLANNNEEPSDFQLPGPPTEPLES